MDKKALGKGLSALIPEKKSIGKKDVVSYIKTDSIQLNRWQPRTDYDEEKLEELKDSIKEKGVLQPVIVRERDGQYELIAGERRIRAVRDLGYEEIPALVKNVSDREALVIALVENIQREELNPIEEAKAYKRLIEEFDYSHEEVAKSVSKDRSTVSNLLRLLKLPKEVQDSVYSGGLSVGHARTLLGIESQNEMIRLFERVVRKQLSVRELENLVKVRTQRGARRGSSRKEQDHEIVSLEEDLQRVLGTKVRIKAQKKRGKIVIEYYSLDDLDRIIEIIKK